MSCSINFLSGSITSEILPPKSLKNVFSDLQESYHLSMACEARFAASLRLKVPSTTLSINFLIMLSVGLNESNTFLKFFTIIVLPTKFLILEIMADTTSIKVLRMKYTESNTRPSTLALVIKLVNSAIAFPTLPVRSKIVPSALPIILAANFKATVNVPDRIELISFKGASKPASVLLIASLWASK